MIRLTGTNNKNGLFYRCFFNSINDAIDFILIENMSKSRNKNSIKSQINKAIKDNKKYLGMTFIMEKA